MFCFVSHSMRSQRVRIHSHTTAVYATRSMRPKSHAVWKPPSCMLPRYAHLKCISLSCEEVSSVLVVNQSIRDLDFERVASLILYSTTAIDVKD